MRAEKVAFYIRLSKSDMGVKIGIKDESNSITGQRALLSSYIREHDEFAGWDIVEYFDDGISGSVFAARDSFQTMLSDAKDGRFSCLMVKDFSRLGRDYIEVGNFMEYVFPAMGIRFISVNDNYDSFARKGIAGGMDVAFKNLIHQMYAMDGSRKVKSAKRARNERGEYTSGLVPYGYRKDPEDVHKFVIDEREAAVVREIFSLVEEGYGYTKIARILNDRGEPTPYEKKMECFANGNNGHSRYSDYRVWQMSAIREIIRNTAYKGQMAQNRFENVGYGDSKKSVRVDRERWSVVDDAIPVIIEADLFDRVNKLRERPPVKHSGKRETNLFVCGHCGRKLVKSGENGRYYCKVRVVKSHTPCAAINMRIEDARRLTLKTVKDIALLVIRNKDYYDRKEKHRIRKIDEETKECEREKERLEKCVLSSYDEYLGGRLSKDGYVSANRICRESIDKIDKRMDELWQELHLTVRVDDEALLECRLLKEYDPDVLAKVVEKVVVYDARHLEVVFGVDDIFKAELPEDAVNL